MVVVDTYREYLLFSHIKHIIIVQHGSIMINLSGRNYWTYIQKDETLACWLENNIWSEDSTLIFDYAHIEKDITSTVRNVSSRQRSYHEAYIRLNRFGDVGILNLFDMSYKRAVLDDYITSGHAYMTIQGMEDKKNLALTKSLVMSYLGHDHVQFEYWSRLARSLFQSKTTNTVGIARRNEYCFSEFLVYATKRLFGDNRMIMDIHSPHIMEYYPNELKKKLRTSGYTHHLIRDYTFGILMIEQLFHHCLFWEILKVFLN
jgi:hypothetical protein